VIIRHLLIKIANGCLAFFFFFIASVNAYEFPPYEGLNLKIEGQIAENYSNNITFASDNEDRIEDLMTMLDLGLGVQYERATRVLGINGRLNRQLRTKSGDFDNSSERISIDFKNEFSKYDRIILNSSYTHTQVPGLLDEGLNARDCKELEDRFGVDQVRQIYPECDKFEEEFGRFTGKFDSYNNIVVLNYSRDFSDLFNIRTGYSYRSHWSPEEGTTDSYGNQASFGINYGYSAITIFSLSYSLNENRYKEGDVILMQSASIGLRRYITELLYVNGKLGMDFSSSSNNVAVEASLAGQIDENTSANISYFQGDQISSDREDIFRSWRVTGGLTRELSEDLRSSISGFYGQGEFISISVTDSLFGGSLDVSYDFWRDKKGKNISGKLGYTYSDLYSTDETRSYSRNGVTLGLTVGF
jgi:hypothetical protein